METRTIFVICAVTLILLLCSSEVLEAKPIITGVYGVRSVSQDQMFQAAKDNGFEIVITADVTQTKAKGLKCLYPFALTKEIAADDIQWQKFVANVKAVVTQFKGNPTIYGWYLADEPDWNQVPAYRYQELNKIIKSIDSSKPTVGVLTLPSKWHKYLPHFDIIAIDPYLPNTSTGKEIDKVKDWIVKIKRDFRKLKLQKELWIVLGAFEEIPKNNTKAAFRKPTPREFDLMLQTCLDNNVAGIFIFCLEKNETDSHLGWNLLRDDPLLWDTVRKTPARVLNN